MKYFLSISQILMLFFLLSSCQSEKDPWVPLVKGDSFDGWSIKNGDASYQVKNGVIIGTTKLNTPNTFLCTQKHYDDFILEFEVLVDSSINSGVQFRSNSFEDFENGRVHGYQAEIDPSERAWSGGIYEEGKRGWLYNLKNNPEGQKAFKNGQWNHYRIEALGDHMAIWVNGINTANLVDDEMKSGFIGLQVHSIGDQNQANKQIKWRNLRIIPQEPKKHKTETTAPQVKL